ncbi:MAG: hypothetical protein ABJE47_21150 [bacterium]
MGASAGSAAGGSHNPGTSDTAARGTGGSGNPGTSDTASRGATGRNGAGARVGPGVQDTARQGTGGSGQRVMSGSTQKLLPFGPNVAAQKSAAATLKPATTIDLKKKAMVHVSPSLTVRKPQ